jgi:hypothetical protein
MKTNIRLVLLAAMAGALLHACAPDPVTCALWYAQYKTTDAATAFTVELAGTDEDGGVLDASAACENCGTMHCDAVTVDAGRIFVDCSGVTPFGCY